MKKRGMKPVQVAQKKVDKGIKLTKLQKMRLKRGYSQTELSEASGVALKTIQQIEQGARPIEKSTAYTVLSLCITLHCKIEDILGDKEILSKYGK